MWSKVPQISKFVSGKSASNIHHAIRIAEATGEPLNRFITINFTEAGCAAENASEKMRWLVSRYRDWARRPSRKGPHKPVRPADVWVFEAGGGVVAVHWLLHIPKGRLADFETRLKVWIEQINVPFQATLSKRAPTPRSLGKYLLKGTDPKFAAFYGAQHEDQGEIIGKRCGYAQRLGPKAKRDLRAIGAYPEARRGFVAHPIKTQAAVSPASGTRPEAPCP